MQIVDGIITEFKDAWRFRYVINSFVSTKLKQRYRRSFLGYFWTILAPFSHYAIIGFVMSNISRSSMPNYFVYMFSGSVFFSVIAGVINGAPMYLIANEHFIKKIYLPKIIFVLNTVALEFVNFSLTAISLVLLGMITKLIHFSIAFLYLPIPILFGMLLLIGLGCVISIASVYFRDLIHILPAVMQAAFFLTPILYSIDMIPTKYHKFILMNPIYYLIECFRIPIVQGDFPPLPFTLALIGMSLFIFLFGMILLKKYDNKIAFRL
ncbi:MAG: hypothetical protein B7Y39_10170 [Bdellovibrio sp. 28-41-41]|nr:MAG: hypothetical protein B7Y39_10170 [Bdellovibrio sp. 28-41-41]